MVLAKIDIAVATVVALFSGGAISVGVQWVLGWFKGRGEAIVNDQARFREELWKEIGALRGQIERMSQELEETRTKYAELLVKHGALSNEHDRLQRDHRELQTKYDGLRGELDEITRERGARA